VPIPWGTDLTTIAPAILNANADVVCGAGAWTTALLSQSAGTPVPLKMVNRFDVYAYIAGVLAITLGATAPTALMIAYALVSGTPILAYTVPVGLLVNSAVILVPFFLSGASSSALSGGVAFNPLIQVDPTAQDVTVTAVGSQALFQLFPGLE